ncbi:Uncharacterised protein [Legionella cherrii]|uniref:Uncharacterized protein n=1 Tax=Legionella cherrii TaxID=28084 RepID=A0ABY6T6X2_9GAMM|nr:Uncharacterised protein [Legionella cherrii]
MFYAYLQDESSDIWEYDLKYERWYLRCLSP